MMRQIFLFTSFLIFIWGGPFRLKANNQSGISAVADSLVKMGLENVRVNEKGDVLRIAYEDKVYRGTYRGLAAVIDKLLRDESIITPVHLVVLENRIPQIDVRMSVSAIFDYRKGLIDWKEFVDSLKISYDTDEDMSMLVEAPTMNRSTGKVDVVLYPQVSLNNSWLDKLYGVVLNIAPAVEVSLWRGASFTGQVIFPVWNNMGGEYDYIRPGMLVLRQELRFPHNLFASFSIGNFNADRMGADISLFYRLSNDRWAFGLNGGLTGSSTFYEGKWDVAQWKKINGSILVQYNEPHYQLEFDLRALRFIYGDYGVRLDCVRHFGEVSVGLFAMCAGGQVNGGFNFAIPLPRKKRGNRRAVRVRLPEYFDWEYQARTGTYYANRLGRTFETRPDENHSRSYYNPDFIRTNLMRLEK